MLLVVAALPCPFAQRGRGGHNYRTEEDKRETRRRLAGQRDPRRGGWNGRGGLEKVEVRKIGGIFRQVEKPEKATLTYGDSRIFRDLVQKNEIIQEVEINRKQIQEVNLKANFINGDTESLFDNTNDEEGSSEFLETPGNKVHSLTETDNKKRYKSVTINGRKTIIKKLKRGKTSKRKLGSNLAINEIVNLKSSQNYTGYQIQDKTVQASSARVNPTRTLNKKGIMLVIQRKRQEGTSGKQNLDSRIQEEGADENKVKFSNKHFSRKTVVELSSKNSFKLPKLFEDLSFPLQNRGNFAENLRQATLPDINLPSNTLSFSNLDFSLFDAQFGGSVPPQPAYKNSQYADPIIRPPLPQIKQIQPPENVFQRPPPAQNTDSDSFSVGL